ncbi:MAG TPA: BPSS1780 family membrane protein [Fluviicoccus sp.]|nr:BPSS1780 family membrane protein [Fluviicoccus sp.]
MSDTENPYRSPAATVVDFSPATGEIEYAAPAHVLNAGHGTTWISNGWQLFKDAPLMWGCAMLLYAGVSFILNLIPILGSIAGMLLAPSLSVGILAFGRAHARDGVTDLGLMFSGFKGEKLGQLMIMALLYVAAIVVTVIVMIIMLAIGLGGMSAISQLEAGNFSGLLGGSGGLMMLVLLLFFLTAVFLIVGAYWFAPGLIFFANLSPVDALKESLMACLRNWLPLTVYSLVAMVIFLVGAIPFGLGLLVVFPVMMASLYPMFEDLYGRE